MFPIIYIEESVVSHPNTKDICKRFPNSTPILCKRYGEVFNRKAQNFRLQKKRPSLILAKKHENFVLKNPPECQGIGETRNYYFSHMINCPFDCRYCFLQGMYRSANYVYFVNGEDFESSIQKKIQEFPDETSCFFSGYDCDSLALEPITHFAEKILLFFEKNPSAILELRTKSEQISFLLDRKPLKNCIIAFTLNPDKISKSLEHKAPSLPRRLSAIKHLQERGWSIGLRFDPLIYCKEFKSLYKRFLQDVFLEIDACSIHSASFGPFRLPQKIYKKISSLYPHEALFAHSMEKRNETVSYSEKQESELLRFFKEELLKYLPENLLFPFNIR